MQEKPRAKAWYLSRTVWLNVLVGLVALLSEAQAFVEGLPDVFPEGFSGAIVGALAVVNLVLRFLTGSEVTRTKEAAELRNLTTKG